MHRRRGLIAAWVLLALAWLALGCPADAQQARPEYQFQYARSHVYFGVHDGRIMAVVLKASPFTPPPTSTRGRTEQVAFRYDYRSGAASFRYHLVSSAETLTVAAGTNGEVTVRREPGEQARGVATEFTQPPSGPLTLTLGSGDKKETYTAPTIWHLLLAHREACSQYLLPFLRILRPDWRLLEQADQIEAELLRAAKRGALPDRNRWAELVAQLADDQFGRREEADRQLRALGQPVVAYLKGLRRDKLDAEQQVRIHRIIRSLSSTQGEESPSQIASALVADPTIWLVLLERDLLETRRLAAAHLARLLEGPIDFDPAADPPARRRQIEALRRRVGP